MTLDLFNYFTQFITQFTFPPFVPTIPTYSIFDEFALTNQYLVDLINVNKDIVPNIQALTYEVQNLSLYFQYIVYLLWWLLVFALIAIVFSFVKFVFYTLRDTFL